MSEFQLTHEQQAIYDLCNNTNDNILIHGKPGVGKSVLIRALYDTTSKYSLAAPTGLAALNIGGKTIHSLFGISSSDGVFAPDYDIFTKNDFVLKHIYHRVNHLIIDEISMVRADMFDYLDRALRFIKGSDLPFGGVQIICVGDFFQLPPVTKSDDKKQLKIYGYKSEFAFDAHSFKDFRIVGLNTVLRQTDADFIGLLHAARTGEVKPAQLRLLNKQVIGKSTDFRISLCATNKQADLINMKNLSLIKEQEVTFEASKYGFWPTDPVERTITLKVGAQVIIKKNNADKPPGVKGGAASGRITNGTVCKVLELPSKDKDYTLVECEDGSTHNIYKQRWERKEKKQVNGRWAEEVVATYEQQPFQLAWAISMHKSQGQSFDKVHIDAARIFAAGQMYVALSRARTLAGVSLASPISADNFWADENVLRFDKQLKHVTV